MSDLTMQYDGHYLLRELKTLKQVRSMKDVTNITHTQYPGTHCPLMGALLVSKGIKDSVALIVGTDECVYYSKSMTLMMDSANGLKGRCASVRLDGHDVTFGSVEKVEEAFAELMVDYSPEAIFLISTCVIEIIGDDFDALAAKMEAKYNIPVLSIHTEHFKCEDHIPGIERSLTACANLMEKQETNGTVNILGQRFGDFGRSELAGVLKKEGIAINLQLPQECMIADIKTATKASLNIVVNSTATDLAKAMHAKFGVDYVVFSKSCSHETNYALYKDLFAKLGKEVPHYITEHYEQAKQNFEAHKGAFAGLTYIYGGSPFAAYEDISLMCELGLKPLLLQVSRLEEKHMDHIKAITQHYDPYVTRTANVTGMMHVYDVLKPDLNFGPAYTHVLMEKKIVPVRFGDSSDMIGLELCDAFIKGLQEAHNAALQYKESSHESL